MRKTALSILFLVLLLGIFVVLEPKVSSLVFAQTRENRWNNFIAEIKQHGELDGKTFWEFREFYSPGYFEFKRSGIDARTVSSTSREMRLPDNFFPGSYPFLVYKSADSISIESLVEKKLVKVFLNKFSNEGTIIARGENFLITQKNDTAWIFLIASLEEMQKANGFFDYREKDKELVKGKYWLTVSSISLRF